MKRCAYDNCHEVTATAHNARYCQECRCKRKEENRVRQLQRTPQTYDAVAWALEENRKQARAERQQAKDLWILENKTFAMFDIEASNLDADFGEILCACIKPLNGKTVTIALPSFTASDPWRLIGDSEIVGAIRDEIAKYDYIVTWYGTKFDMPYLTSRLIAADETPLGWMRHLDLYYTSRWKLKLHSNRLASVGDFLFGKTKKDSIVGGIWLAALRGDKAALDYIIKHCQKDVVELERVFKELAAYRNVSATPLRRY